MKIQIINAAKVSATIALICAISSFAYLVALVMNLGGFTSILFYNPFISAFVHSDMTHYIMNILMLFLCLIPSINRLYTYKKVLYTAIILNTLYFPLVIFQVTLPIIGLSMFTYFLMGRIAVTRKKHKWLFLAIFFLILIGEISQIKTETTIAHLSHVIGALVGIISIKFSSKKHSEKFLIEEPIVTNEPKFV